MRISHALIILLLTFFFTKDLFPQSAGCAENDYPASVSAGYSEWNQESLEFARQIHLVSYRYKAEDLSGNPFLFSMLAEHRFMEKEKSRSLLSFSAESRYFQFYAGWRYLPLLRSRYLTSDADYTGFCHLPHPRNSSSVFLKISSYYWIPGIFLISKTPGAGSYWVHPSGFFFTAYHHPSRTGSVFWNTMNILKRYGIAGFGEIRKLGKSWEGYAFASLKREVLFMAAEAEKKKTWEQNYTEDRLFRSGQLSLYTSTETADLSAYLPSRISAAASMRDQSEHRMKYYELRTDYRISEDLRILLSADHRQYSLRTYHEPKKENSYPVRNSRVFAGLFSEKNSFSAGIRAGADARDASPSASLWFRWKKNGWSFYGVAEWEKKDTPFLVLREEGEMESSLRYYPVMNGSALFQIRSDIVQFRLQTFLNRKGTLFTVASAECSIRF